MWLALVSGGVALVWATSIAVFGGVSLRIFGIPVSSHDPFRVLLIGAILGAIGLIGAPVNVSIAQPNTRRTIAMSATATLAVITIVLGVGLRDIRRRRGRRVRLRQPSRPLGHWARRHRGALGGERPLA